MSLPRSQEWFILRMQKMGYASCSKGVCFGLAHMAMQAILADEIDLFDARLEKINNLSLDSLAQTINDLKEKRTKTKNLSIDPLLEIPVFFEGVELYQQAYLYPFLFEEENKPTAQNAMAVAPLILPQVFKENNIEINKPAIFTGAYNQQELIDHFQSLRSAIQQSDPPLLKPFTMILRSGNHAITVAYDPKKDEWLFIDPNELPTQHIKGSNNIIAKKVLSAFSSNGMTTFSTAIYTTNTNKTAIEACINNWKNQEAWKKIHTVSEKKAAMVDSFNASWLFIATEEGLLETVNVLLAANANVNHTGTDGVTALYIAALHGHLEIVKALLNAHANVNLACTDGATALYIAAQNGHLEIVKALLNANANVDLACTAGATALFIAAQKGHLDIVRLLLSKGAKIDAAFKNDAQPLRKFAKKNNVEARMEELIEEKQSTSTTSISITSEEIATVMGHAEIKETLIKFKQLDEFVLSLRKIATTYHAKTLFHGENTKRKISVNNIMTATNEAYRSFANGVEIDEVINTLKKTAEKISQDTKKDHSKRFVSSLFTQSRLAKQIDAVVLPSIKTMS